MAKQRPFENEVPVADKTEVLLLLTERPRWENLKRIVSRKGAEPYLEEGNLEDMYGIKARWCGGKRYRITPDTVRALAAEDLIANCVSLTGRTVKHHFKITRKGELRAENVLRQRRAALGTT